MERTPLARGCVGVTVLTPSISTCNEERWRVWKLYKCPSCGHEIYTEHESDRDKQLLQLEKLQQTQKISLPSSNFSFAFLPPHVEGSDLELDTAALAALDQQFAQFIERERSAMEERIQVYTAHQHQLFSDLQNRALSERNVLLYQTTLTERKSVAIEEIGTLEVEQGTKSAGQIHIEPPKQNAQSPVPVSSMRLIKDEISVTASGERETVKTIETDPSRKETAPLTYSSRNAPEASTQFKKPEVQVVPDHQRASSFVKAKKQRSLEPALFDFDDESLGSDRSDNDADDDADDGDDDDAFGEKEDSSLAEDNQSAAFPYASSLPVTISHPYLKAPPAAEKVDTTKKHREKFIEPHVFASLQVNELAILTDRPSSSWRPATMHNV